MEIDYFTTQKIPPSLHTLSKNYLDLLHKPMPHIDSYKGLLFNDDRQIKILILNYHIDDPVNYKIYLVNCKVRQAPRRMTAKLDMWKILKSMIKIGPSDI
jgi:hypothetical protein